MCCWGCASGAAEGEEEELLTEEPGSVEAARQEACTAGGLSNAIRAWHASHRGALSPHTSLALDHLASPLGWCWKPFQDKCRVFFVSTL